MKVSFFFVSIFLASSSAETIDLNDQVDLYIRKNNKATVNHRMLKISIGEIIINGTSAQVDFAEGVILGLDSLRRTGDCFEVIDGTSKTFTIEIGLKMMVFALQKVSIDGVLMSAFFSVVDNSLLLVYTVHDEDNCEVTVDVLQVERFQNIFFGTSRTDFNEKCVDETFQNVIRNWLNEWLDTQRSELENSLQVRCSLPIVKEMLLPTDLKDAVMNLLEDIAII